MSGESLAAVLLKSHGEGASAVALHFAANDEWIETEAMVVSRALPDVRDGPQPVQRRDLYTMGPQDRTPDAKQRTCTQIPGDGQSHLPPSGRPAHSENPSPTRHCF